MKTIFPVGGFGSKVEGSAEGISVKVVAVKGVAGSVVAVVKSGMTAWGVVAELAVEVEGTARGEPGTGRFVIMYASQLPMTHNTNTPQPKPPKRYLSKVEMDFRRDCIRYKISTLRKSGLFLHSLYCAKIGIK